MSNLRKQTGSEECAHSTDFFTKERIASKIKQIRTKHRKSLYAEWQSEEGRIVATFYDLCSETWSASPATESIQSIQNNGSIVKNGRGENILFILT